MGYITWAFRRDCDKAQSAAVPTQAATRDSKAEAKGAQIKRKLHFETLFFSVYRTIFSQMTFQYSTAQCLK